MQKKNKRHCKITTSFIIQNLKGNTFYSEYLPYLLTTVTYLLGEAVNGFPLPHHPSKKNYLKTSNFKHVNIQ